MSHFGVDAAKHLPDHDALLDAILGFFNRTPGAIGSFLSGSTATGQLDVDSDLDVGVVFESADSRSTAWEGRWNWQIAPWFHRFDADHIKPHFVIYVFEPAIRADINLYLVDELPPAAGGPYVIAWDETGALQKWLDALPVQEPSAPNWNAPDWGAAVHEDERFWAWLVYLYDHAHRGEYYVCAYGFPQLRDILEQWTARLAGHTGFSPRRLEDEPWAERLLGSDLFPKPDRESLKACMLSAIELQLQLRSEIGELELTWKTAPKAIAKVTRLIESL